MIAEVVIGGITSIILGSLWFAKAIVGKTMDKDARDEARDAFPEEKVYPFVDVGGSCSLCGSYGMGNYRVGNSLTCKYENGYLRQTCTNCGGSYLMELATKG